MWIKRYILGNNSWLLFEPTWTSDVWDFLTVLTQIVPHRTALNVELKYSNVPKLDPCRQNVINGNKATTLHIVTVGWSLSHHPLGQRQEKPWTCPQSITELTLDRQTNSQEHLQTI